MDGFTIKNANQFLDTGRISSQSLLNPKEQSSASGSTSFADTLKEAIGSVNELQKASDKAMEQLATGKTENVADVMIAAEKADIALKLMVQVRNKIIDAYQEVMKMQV